MKKYFLLILFPLFAQAGFEAPHRMTTGRTDFLSRALWEGCYSMETDGTLMGLPCNPAYLESVSGEKIFVQAIASNNVQYFRDAYEVLMYKASTATVRRLFSQSRDARFEGDAEIHYQKENWAVSFSPTRTSYYTLVRNQVLPYISLYASNEQVLRGQMSWFWNPEIRLGLQARAIVRTYILSEFFATDAVVENSNVLRKRYQNLFFVDPGLVWSPSAVPLQTQVSATIKQVGFSNHHYSRIADQPEAELGLTVSPEVSQGRLRLGPHLSFNSQATAFKDQLRFSSLYELHQISYLASLGKSEVSLGAYATKNAFNGGMTFNLESVESLKGRDENIFTWAVQLGYEI